MSFPSAVQFSTAFLLSFLAFVLSFGSNPNLSVFFVDCFCFFSLVAF